MASPTHRQRRPQRPAHSAEDVLSFGAWLRQRRRALDLTQAALAQRVGCARITIRRIEADELKPSQQLAELFAEYLGVPPAQRKSWLQFARGLAPMPPPQVTDLPAPTPATPPRLPTNLPVPLTTFLGRDHEIIDGCRLVTTSRLLTLTGVGGAGKTRLALEIARSILDFRFGILDSGNTHNPKSKIQNLQFPDGIWWVELAPLTDATLIPETVAKVLGLREQPGQSLERLLAEMLQTKQMLLLLDNCEHLVAACAQWVQQWLHHAPHLHILATSREPLHLLGEQRFPVAPLAAATASELFVQRARLVDPAFTRTAANRAAIDQLCQQVDYLPLAIELLAARSDLFSPQAMLERLQKRPLDLLSAELRDLPARQRTLCHTIQHSYDLLTQREQALFRTLGAFVGGFNLAAVAYFDYTEAELQALVHKNLVQREMRTNSERRFLLLEMLREYACTQLVAYGEMAPAQRRHAEYFLAFAENIKPYVANAEEQVWHEHLERDEDNLRTALRYYLNTDVVTAVRMAGALGEFWYFRGQLSEGYSWLVRALAHTEGIDSLARCKALREAGRIALAKGDYTQATLFLDESLEIARRLDDQCGMAYALNFRGYVSLYQLDLDGAYTLLEQSLLLQKTVGNQYDLGVTLRGLGLVAMYQGDYPKAQTLFQESLNISEALGDAIGIELLLTNLGYNELRQGSPARSLAYFKKAIQGAEKQGDKEGIACCLDGLAEVSGLHGETLMHKRRAISLLSAARALRSLLGISLTPTNLSLFERTTAMIRNQLDEGAFAAAWAEGEAMTLDEAVAYALTVQYDGSL